MKFISLNQLPLYTDEFFFTDFDNPKVRDAIVVYNPPEAIIISPVFLRSRKPLEEHIEYINSNNIKKAYIIADDISFLTQCPCLEFLKVYPAITAQSFDYSPLYEMPNIKWIECKTTTGPNEDLVGTIDYSRIKGIKRLGISHAGGHLNVEQAGDVISLYFDFGFPNAKNLNNSIPGKMLRSFAVCQAPIQSLDGIENAPNLCSLELSHNRRLADISALRFLSETLNYLEIDTCGRIQDFSVLSELHSLEFLTLKGANVLQNLSFLKNMPRLKHLHLTMNVKDGNLSLCEHVPYVKIKNRKHYSHKDIDLPKDFKNPDELIPFNVI